MKSADEILDELIEPAIAFTAPPGHQGNSPWCEVCYNLIDEDKLGIKYKSFIDFDNPSGKFFLDNVANYFYMMILFAVCEKAEKFKFEFQNYAFSNKIYIQDNWCDLEPPPSFIAMPFLKFLISFFDKNPFEINGNSFCFYIKHNNQKIKNNITFDCERNRFKILVEFNIA